MKSRIFALYLISFIFGIFLGDYLKISEGEILKIFFYSLLFLFIFLKIKIIKHIFFCFLIILAGVFILKHAEPKNEPSWTNFYNESEIDLNGVVISEPSGEKVTRFYFEPKDSKGNIVVVTERRSDIRFGDKLNIKGKLTEAVNKTEFDYKSYLEKDHVYSEFNFPKITKIDFSLTKKQELVISVKKKLFNIKNYFVSTLEKIYPEPNGSLMLGLLLGIKNTMPDDLLESFNKTGTTHIIALSGFNITIIVLMLKVLTSQFSPKIRFYLPLTIIFLFVIMTGAEAPVVRAAIMGSMLLLANKFGRQDDSIVAIIFAGAVMVFENPLILKADIGFQLSFACMLGVIFLTPIFGKLFRGLPKLISEILAMTLAAQLAAIPIILYYFSNVSVISPLANILILPLVPLAMFFGAVSGFLYFIYPYLGEAFGWIGYLLTGAIIGIARELSLLPYAALDFKINLLFVIGYYLILIEAVLIFYYKRSIFGTK